MCILRTHIHPLKTWWTWGEVREAVGCRRRWRRRQVWGGESRETGRCTEMKRRWLWWWEAALVAGNPPLPALLLHKLVVKMTVYRVLKSCCVFSALFVFLSHSLSSQSSLHTLVGFPCLTEGLKRQSGGWYMIGFSGGDFCWLTETISRYHSEYKSFNILFQSLMSTSAYLSTYFLRLYVIFIYLSLLIILCTHRNNNKNKIP